MAFIVTTNALCASGYRMLTGILIGAGIMLTYIAVGLLAGRQIRNLGRKLAEQDSSDSIPPLT
jgi:hypothetical protein